MKALLLDGSEDPGSNLARGANLFTERLEASGWGVRHALLRDLALSPCTGCFSCWVATPGCCAHRDDAGDLVAHAGQCDLLVLASPVSFGGLGWRAKVGFERVVLPILLPYFRKDQGEYHHPLRYGRPMHLIAIGGLKDRDGASETLFTSLLERTVRNLHSPSNVSTFLYDGMDPGEVERAVSALPLPPKEGR